MMRDAFTTALIVGLVAVMTASVVGKLTSWEQTTVWFDELLTQRVPSRRHAPLLVVVMEVGVIVALAAEPQLGAIALAAWIGVASIVLFRARSRITDCNCFGKASSLGKSTVLRNISIAGGAVGLALMAESAWSGQVETLAAGVAIGTAAIVLLGSPTQGEFA